jgi:hypothetical protein
MHVPGLLSCRTGSLSSSQTQAFELDYARGGGSSGGERRVCGARVAVSAGRTEWEEENAKLTSRAGMEVADGHGRADGQPGGIPGMSHGTPLEQGASLDGGIAVSSPMAEEDATGADDCVICIPPASPMPMPKPLPATIRWRKNSPARSNGKRRERVIMIQLI